MKQDLIYSRAANNGFLSLDHVAAKAPAAFAVSPSEQVSNRYGFFDTKDAIAAFDSIGYGITQALQVRSRKPGDKYTARHMLAFAPRSNNTEALSNSDTVRPEIILYNAHNATSSMRLYSGAFRFICSNGLIAGDGTETKLKHYDVNESAFLGAIASTSESMPGTIERMRRFQEVKLSDAAMREFAFKAALLRWTNPSEYKQAIETEQDPSGVYVGVQTVNDLNAAQRFEDGGADLWRTFNRVQENIIGGGAKVMSITGKKEGYRTAKAVKAAPEVVRINRELWNLAEEFAAA
jgi:hypothetical protein